MHDDRHPAPGSLVSAEPLPLGQVPTKCSMPPTSTAGPHVSRSHTRQDGTAGSRTVQQSAMMRLAWAHTASIAPTISCCPIRTSSSRRSICCRHAGIDQGGSAAPTRRRATGHARWHDVLTVGNEEILRLETPMNLAAGRRRAIPLASFSRSCSTGSATIATHSAWPR